MKQPAFDIPNKIANESDAERWFDKASKLVRRNKWLEAIAIYDELGRQLSETDNGRYAHNCAAKLRGYIDNGGVPADGPYAGPSAEELGLRPFTQTKILSIIIAILASIVIYFIGFSRHVPAAIPATGFIASLLWFTNTILWGSGFAFNGILIYIVPVLDVDTPYGDFGVVFCLPIRRLGAYLQVIHAKWTLAIPWYCSWRCLFMLIGSASIGTQTSPTTATVFPFEFRNRSAFRVSERCPAPAKAKT